MEQEVLEVMDVLSDSNDGDVLENRGDPVDILESSSNVTHLHISPFTPAFNIEHISDILAKKGIPKEHTEIKKIVGRNYNTSTLTFVSFKVSCRSGFVDRLNEAEFWPNAVRIQPFVPRNKFEYLSSSDDNFMDRNSNPRYNI